MIPTVFERTCSAGWLYPCTTDDRGEQLSQFPASDLEGLWAVGLVPSTRRDCSANARYFPGKKPVIHIYSSDQSLTYKQPPHTRRGDIERGLSMERMFGMTVERAGSRWICRWNAADWRRFILEHVLAHEIGHHVLHQQRLRENLCEFTSKTTGEQFAEAYACRC